MAWNEKIGGPDCVRQPHAVLDARSRRLKAMKIERLLALSDWRGRDVLRVLEIGVGGGGIASYFGAHPSGRYQVVGIDTVDQRVVREGYVFRSVESVDLPFPADSFDVIISNHVIEHVGGDVEQRRHLAEIYRVLRRKGRAYLALPNRWMFIEPHFRLPFLSWLPRSWADHYVRLARRGSNYDCRPLTGPATEAMLTSSGFDFVQHHRDALDVMLELEGSHVFAARVLRGLVGARVSHAARHAYPTLIYTLEKGRSVEPVRP